MVNQPGDLVQVDTLDVRPLDGRVVKHFTARDEISRWEVLEAHQRAIARTAAEFLNTILARMPFPVKANPSEQTSHFFRYTGDERKQ